MVAKENKKRSISQREKKSSRNVESERQEADEDSLDEKYSEDDLDVSNSEDELDDNKSEDDLDDKGSEDELDSETNEEEESNKKQKLLEDGSSKSSKEQHAEQRKLLKERKLKRNAGVEIERIKSLWEKLRVKNPPIPKEVQKKLCNEIWDLSKDCIKDLVFKHDSSRVVQTLVKYSTPEIRKNVIAELKNFYPDLAKSSYGKYLLVKLLHYGSKESRQLIINELHGHYRKLLRHKEGAYVLEDLFILYSNNKQRKQIIREFYGSKYALFKDTSKDGETIVDIVKDNQDSRSLIASNLNQTITAAVGKGSTGFHILHHIMKEYIQIASDKEFVEFIELLQDQIAELVHTPEGSEVACSIIAKATAKQRKTIIKNLKPHAKAMLTNEHGNLVLLTIFLTVDDTVLVYKTFGNEFTENMSDLIVDKFARRPLLYLLCGLDGKYFNPQVLKTINHYIESSKQTSKKPQETRRSELLKKFVPSFYDCIIKFNGKVFSENMGLQFATELLIHAPVGESEDLRKQAISSIVNAFIGDISSELHFINKPFASRFCKTLIQGGQWNFKKQIVEKDNESGLGVEFAHQLINILDEDLTPWINSNNGSFVIVALFETLSKEKDSDSKNFVKLVQKYKKLLNKVSDDNKGGKLLLSLIAAK